MSLASVGPFEDVGASRINEHINAEVEKRVREWIAEAKGVDFLERVDSVVRERDRFRNALIDIGAGGVPYESGNIRETDVHAFARRVIKGG